MDKKLLINILETLERKYPYGYSLEEFTKILNPKRGAVKNLFKLEFDFVSTSIM